MAEERKQHHMNELLTVIIPVYKVYNTIDRCLKSITNQEYKNLEIILVDDGSPDDCPRKCDEWAAHDNRITVIHKPNGGLSDARNVGIDAAKGRFITFVDSDDYVSETTYQDLMQIMAEHDEYDILEYSVFRFFGSAKQSILQFEDKEYHDMTDYWLVGKAYEHTYAWNKIYKRELFCNVRFPVGRVFEDVYTLPLLLKNAGIVATTSKGMYYYCSNSEGITAKAGANELQMLLDANLKIADKYKGHRLFYQYYMSIVNIQISVHELTGDNPKLWRMHIDCFNGLNNKSKLKAITINILGIKGLCILNGTIKKIARIRW